MLDEFELEGEPMLEGIDEKLSTSPSISEISEDTMTMEEE